MYQGKIRLLARPAVRQILVPPRLDAHPVLPSAPVLSVLAALPRDADVVVVRDGPSWVIGVEPTRIVAARGEDAFGALDRLDGGWWAGFLSYDLGGRSSASLLGSLTRPAFPTWPWLASTPG